MQTAAGRQNAEASSAAANKMQGIKISVAEGIEDLVDSLRFFIRWIYRKIQDFRLVLGAACAIIAGMSWHEEGPGEAGRSPDAL